MEEIQWAIMSLVDHATIYQGGETYNSTENPGTGWTKQLLNKGQDGPHSVWLENDNDCDTIIPAEFGVVVIVNGQWCELDNLPDDDQMSYYHLFPYEDWINTPF